MATDLNELRVGFDSRLMAHFAHQRTTRLARFPALAEAIAYSLGAGGKRVRALLALGACRACGGDEEAAATLGVAIEYLHCYSLIHDDLPALDNDDMRRGSPASHKRFGEAMAILAGDALQGLCHATLAQINSPNQPEIAQLVGDAALLMVGGQSLDILATPGNTNAAGLEIIHRNKTGALISASLAAGGLCAQETTQAQQQALARMGESLGLAFQITDDLLEHSQSSEELGKSSASDARNAQPTYPSIMGEKAARQQVAECHAATRECLSIFDPARAGLLNTLCEYLLQRTS